MSPKAIKRLRERLKLTQTAAAALVRVTPNTWARWERGESQPRGLHQRRAITLLPRLACGKMPHPDSARQSWQVVTKQSPRRRSTGRSLLKYVGTWAGDDIKWCLKLVYATRGLAKL